MTGASRRALGYGLLALALGIAALMVLWLLTSGAQAGGIVLGLLLMLVIAGPLGGVAAYLLSSSRQEAVAEQAFVTKQHILDADRLFRGELAARLRELAASLGPAGERIRYLARAAERSVGDEAAWYAAIQLTDAQIAVLRQYDDLVWERVRWLHSHTDASQEVIIDAIAQLERAMDQRTDLLVRGRQAPAVAPSELITGSHSSSSSKALQDVVVGDAVTRDGVDYIVEAVATSFADGQTWKLAHLVPSGADGTEHWLEVSPAGLDVAWLDRVAPPATPWGLELASMPLVSSASAAVAVSTREGQQPSVLVANWRYRSPAAVGLVQQWPDGALHAYMGKLIRPDELQIWPSVVRMQPASTT